VLVASWRSGSWRGGRRRDGHPGARYEVIDAEYEVISTHRNANDGDGRRDQ
jgi:hypothetical protein